MRYVLGVDGGGTKTECVLLDETGRVQSRSQSGPSNPLRVGFGGALASICEAARGAVQNTKISLTEISAICAGLAGTAQSEAEGKMKRLLEEEFPGKPVRVCMDLELILAAVGEGAAIVLIAGTGSGAVGRAAGRVARVGGRGPLLSDEGSAYDIGRRAAMLVIQEFDRTDANSGLGARILRDLNCATWQEFQNRAIALPDEVLPRVFPVVASAADEGDSAAQRLLQNAASDLSFLVASLMEKLGLESQQFLLVSSGGMLGRSKFFDQQLAARLRDVAPLAEFGALAITPAESAARLALQLLQPQPREGN